MSGGTRSSGLKPIGCCKVGRIEVDDLVVARDRDRVGYRLREAAERVEDREVPAGSRGRHR